MGQVDYIIPHGTQLGYAGLMSSYHSQIRRACYCLLGVFDAIHVYVTPLKYQAQAYSEDNLRSAKGNDRQQDTPTPGKRLPDFLDKALLPVVPR